MANLFIKNVRLSFPTLWEPVEFKAGDGRPRWSATFLVEHDSKADIAIKTAIAEEAKATWKDKAEKLVKQYSSQKGQCCYRDGDNSEYDGYEGMMALTCHRSAVTKSGVGSPPLILDRNPKIVLTARDGRPYAGCYVNAKVSIYMQTGENPGIRASFEAVQFADDGDAFGSPAPSAEGFEEIEDDSDPFA